jgi:hypothetical protein
VVWSVVPAAGIAMRIRMPSVVLVHPKHLTLVQAREAPIGTVSSRPAAQDASGCPDDPTSSNTASDAGKPACCRFPLRSKELKKPRPKLARNPLAVTTDRGSEGGSDPLLSQPSVLAS